jgi:hypothetical protein
MNADLVGVLLDGDDPQLASGGGQPQSLRMAEVVHTMRTSCE